MRKKAFLLLLVKLRWLIKSWKKISRVEKLISIFLNDSLFQQVKFTAVTKEVADKVHAKSHETKSC